MRVVGTALVTLVVAAPLLAQSNAERLATGHDTRSHDYDLVHQQISLKDFNWDSLTFTGRAVTTVVALRPHFDSLVLDAGALLRIRDVRGGRGERLRFAARGDTLVVYLSRAAQYGEKVTAAIYYAGRVVNGRGLTFIRDDGRPHRPRQLWSMGEPDDNHLWFPTYDAPNDKETWELDATVPTSMMVVSNGRLVSDTRRTSATHIVRWSQDSPASTYLVSIVIGRLARVRRSWHGIYLDAYVYADDTARARVLFAMTPSVMDIYGRLLGVKYPWPKYAQTTVADFFGGEEMVSATTLVDWLPDARAYRDQPWYRQILIPHELAHQWFGDYVTTANWANVWLNEGMAEFMNGAYWDEKTGRLAGGEFFLDEYEQYLAIDSRKRTPLAALGSNNIYPKGALVLRMLQRYLGNERFWASMHRYLIDHRFGVAITEDLRRAILDATGENLAWFFEEWMYAEGHPELAASASWDSAAATLTVRLQQMQSDSARMDSLGGARTPAVFRMPIRIRVGTAAGDVLHDDSLAERDQSIRIDGVRSAPTMVVLDDGNRILKTLSFPQPTPWLAEQLARDPEVWDRAWVIDQLERLADDTTAARALAAAAIAGDCPVIRARAVGALPAVAGDGALPTLVRAAADTSSAVRRAAIIALGAVGGPEALALAHRAFEQDSSYQVRAAAVVTLAKIDSAGRTAVLTRALSTPSYRDVIQSAALDQIARLGDSAFVPQLEGLIAGHPRVALTLGALAAHGSAQALDALSTRLDDDRPWVRAWSASAFERIQPRQLAADRLREVAPTLRHADARRAAAAFLAGSSP
ncbi:MAG TPA: M1 family aminopeptidase [Gemmatimonadaceae bacterium]|nr:M1 family aminopeptidase [Gemmatimonadaceae bacterium]